MANRPDPWGEPPDGYEFVVAAAGGWRLVTGKQCSSVGKGRARCQQAAVAELNRPRTRSYGGRRGVDLRIRDAWYAYCGGHMGDYRRWIEDGQVVGWILREIKREPELPEGAVQRAAEVMLRQYDSQYSAGHLTWRDFAGDAEEILRAALLPGGGNG